MKKKSWFWLGGALVIASIWGIVFLRSMVSTFYVPSASMEPTLRVSDWIMLDKRAYRNQAPRRNDIAIVNLSNAQTQGDGSKGETYFIKRVIGAPGQTVEIVKGVLKVNGKTVAEPFVTWKGGPKYDLKIVAGEVYEREKGSGVPDLWAKKSVIADDQDSINNALSQPIPAGEFLVLGDNRGNSNDSHIFGLVDGERFIGRVKSIYAPKERRREF